MAMRVKAGMDYSTESVANNVKYLYDVEIEKSTHDNPYTCSVSYVSSIWRVSVDVNFSNSSDAQMRYEAMRDTPENCLGGSWIGLF